MMEKLTRARFTNLHKVLYPGLGVKKYQIIEYYIKIAPLILDFLEGRIVTLNRLPEGVDSEGFYMKDAPRGTIDRSIGSRNLAETKREIEYLTRMFPATYVVFDILEKDGEF